MIQNNICAQIIVEKFLSFKKPSVSWKSLDIEIQVSTASLFAKYIYNLQL